MRIVAFEGQEEKRKTHFGKKKNVNKLIFKKNLLKKQKTKNKYILIKIVK